ncbi:MAG: cyclodeaminase/cyclohydrolase family protein [Bacillota bacterium]|nr:cyclodeaminase/cyclohydrolase family protein [Bacillota bacterium]
MIEKTCREFMEQLSSNAPTPGGGSAAALGGALGAGLANMVASLTVGKKKYAEHEQELRQLLAEGLQLQRQLLELVEDDIAVFTPLSQAYALPAGSEQQKLDKARQISVCAIAATRVPLAIMEKSLAALRIAARAAAIGSRLAVSDAACAASFLNAAVVAASYNVRINLPSIMDCDFAAAAQAQMDDCLREAPLLLAKTLAQTDVRL